uniref:Retrovirus-related Pol polyprotein from transposon TNT 1-94 n=1 Tax=Tanacetum cinerariifolium TaxID=118510 RepID=A0A699H0P3_TANCI|nr:hypothetical protein [Tanacetum cinerariifolium]
MISFYAYLSQYEAHPTKVRLMRERFLDPLALISNNPHIPSYQTNHLSQYNSTNYQQQSTPVSQQHYPSQQHSQSYEAPSHYQQFKPLVIPQQPSIPQTVYYSPLISQQAQAEFPQLDSGLVVPSFLPSDDPIASLNKAMTFMSTVMESHFLQPKTNSEHLPIQETKLPFKTAGLLFNKYKGDRVTVLLGEEHMARQCTKPKKIRTFAWFKEKMLLIQAHESGQVLDEEQLAFFVDLGVTDGQATQTIIIHNATFQTNDLDTYDSDCDDISSAKAVLMANLSSYDSDVLSEVPNSNTYQTNDMINQSVQEMQYSKHTPIDDYPDNEITSYSNILSYSQYLHEA